MRLPPGRASPGTIPAATALPVTNTMVNRGGGRLERTRRRRSSCGHDEVEIELHQLAGEHGKPRVVPVGPAVLDEDVVAFHVAEIAQPGAKGVTQAAAARFRKAGEISDPDGPSLRARNVGRQHNAVPREDERDDDADAWSP